MGSQIKVSDIRLTTGQTRWLRSAHDSAASRPEDAQGRGAGLLLMKCLSMPTLKGSADLPQPPNLVGRHVV